MNAIVSARGVTRRFGGLVALDNVDLDIPQGIVQAIIGPNGSGKTTLLNALSGASHADSGSIRIDGAEIFRLKPHRIAPFRRGSIVAIEASPPGINTITMMTPRP